MNYKNIKLLSVNLWDDSNLAWIVTRGGYIGLLQDEASVYNSKKAIKQAIKQAIEKWPQNGIYLVGPRGGVYTLAGKSRKISEISDFIRAF